jgi:molybdopterin synthase sulfur carrier subunit
MKIEVKLFATLRRHLPPDATGRKATIEVEGGITVRSLVEQLKIPPELTQIVLVNGETVEREQDRVLQDGDTVSIFPPVAGGSFKAVA